MFKENTSPKNSKPAEMYEKARMAIDEAEQKGLAICCMAEREKGVSITGANCGTEIMVTFVAGMHKKNPIAFSLAVAHILAEAGEE